MKEYQFDLFSSCNEEKSNDKVTWKEEEISVLRERVLIRSLEFLALAKRTESKQEILDWINCNSMDNPFSFSLCCQDSGYQSEVLRDSLNSIYKRH